MAYRDDTDKAGSCDVYDLTLEKALSDLIGKVLVDWGLGARAWVQHADRRNKPIMELRREFKEPDFPGFLNFIEPLSRLDKLPKDWVAVLRSSRGVYLLTCPKTKEQYIGLASGENGFWGGCGNSFHSGRHRQDGNAVENETEDQGDGPER